MRPRFRLDPDGLATTVKDRLDVRVVRIDDERGVVTGVILGSLAGLAGCFDSPPQSSLRGSP
jgi:hypothetical protein